MSAAKRPELPPLIPHPFKPRRGLFIGLLVLMAAWIGALIAMYFKTVRR